MLPPENGTLMSIESWNMYKMPFKSDNPLLDMIFSKKTQLMDKRCKNWPKWPNFEFSSKKQNCHFFTYLETRLHAKNQKILMRGFLDK